MTKVKFSKEDMLDILDDRNVIISDEIYDNRRWSIDHVLIFKKDDKFYQTYYSVGATESQDESPWEYVKEVECVEVEPKEVTIIQYVPIVP